ncbi:MAG: sulfite exporter TauE/SafE family protein [Phycisphaeraceae bacterium]|nr:MAG: sulfite exporter TauE/SafE family protein [Phycisphaeraceae bacterium]
MTPLVVSVLVASLLGSLHCAGMCGAFLAMALAEPATPGTPDDRTLPPRPVSGAHAMYHAGRLATYAALGALAGGLGLGLDSAGSLAGVQRAAAIVAAVGLGLIGAAILARGATRGMPRLPVPAALTRAADLVMGRAMRLPVRPRALVIGLATAFIPCGWLWAFVLTAAGTGDPLHAAMLMGVFWLGTLPVMVSVGIGLTAGLGPLTRRLPTLTGLALILAAAATVMLRVSPDACHTHDPLVPASLPGPSPYADSEVPRCN